MVQMQTSLCSRLLPIGLVLWVVLQATETQAAMDSANLLDSVLDRYQAAASGWASVITAAASRLFWTLVVISMVWTFGMMALRKADIAEFFAEFMRFTVFTGLFWWLLTNGPNFALSIMNSLKQLGGQATGLGSGMSPSGVVDIGFAVFDRVVENSSLWDPVTSVAGLLMAAVILVILALVAVNMLLLLVSGWILAYGGVFFLGFGGSRWTSEMAINYYKMVLGIGAQLLTMVLIIGIGKTFLDDYYAQMSEQMPLKDIAVLMIVCVILLMLVNKLPGLVSNIVSGGGSGHTGIGQFGAGAAMGAAGMAVAAASAGGAAVSAGMASMAGGAQALMAAYTQAQENVSSGTDVLSSMASGSSEATPTSGNTSSSASAASFARSSFAQAAGISGQQDQATPSASPGSASAGSSGSGDRSRMSSGSIGQGASGVAGAAEQGSAAWGSLLQAATHAGKVAVDAGANLASGAKTVAQDRLEAWRSSAADRIADTTGGQIAAAIREQGRSGVEFPGNSLSGAPLSPEQSSEVESFIHRPAPSDPSSGPSTGASSGTSAAA
jgi:type IV secretion system protein VirB6/type IV secretion system protein TrbL